MRTKFVVCGALIGIAISSTISLLSPNFLNWALSFSQNFNEALGYQANYYSAKGGSLSNATALVVVPFAILGGVVGLIISKSRE